MLQHKMPVQQHGLHFGQHVVVAIQITPARLHHPDLGIGKMMNGVAQEIDGRDEIGIEHGHDFALRGHEAVLQRARFIAVTIGAVNIFDRQSGCFVFAHQALRERVGIVG